MLTGGRVVTRQPTPSRVPRRAGGSHLERTRAQLSTITQDVTRVMNRIKALYRSWAIPCAGTIVYAPRHRAEWLGQIEQPGVRSRAERLYQQLDLLQPLRLAARR